MFNAQEIWIDTDKNIWEGCFLSEQESSDPISIIFISVDPVVLNIDSSVDYFYGKIISVGSAGSVGNLSCSIIAACSLSIELHSPSIHLAVSANAEVNIFEVNDPVILYFFTLTGSQNNESDIQIPIKSFQSRLRNGTPTYLSVVVPGVNNADEIKRRAAGDLAIAMAHLKNGAVLHSEEIVRARLEDINISEGGKDQSIVLTGHKTDTWRNKTVFLKNPTYRNISKGKLTYRFAAPNMLLKPGDTVMVDNDSYSFIAGLISINVSVSQQTMEISEA